MKFNLGMTSLPATERADASDGEAPKAAGEEVLSSLLSSRGVGAELQISGQVESMKRGRVRQISPRADSLNCHPAGPR